MTSQKRRGGYRGKPKPKLPEHLKRVPVNARIQKWMLDQLKEKGEVGYILEEILIRSGFRYSEKQYQPSVINLMIDTKPAKKKHTLR